MNHQILPGSLEIENDVLTAGVHTGTTEWDIVGLRYVRGNVAMMYKADTVLTFLGRIYDTTEGCLINGSFKEKTS